MTPQSLAATVRSVSAVPPQPPPPSSAPIHQLPTTRDLEHLRLLGVLHYVLAGLQGFGLLFTTAYFILVGFFISQVPSWSATNGGGLPEDFPVEILAAILTGLAVFAAVFGLIKIVLNILAGRFLRQQRHRTFCFVVAALNCLSFPLGTALAVFTFIVLGRESVARRFEANAPRATT